MPVDIIFFIFFPRSSKNGLKNNIPGHLLSYYLNAQQKFLSD